MKNDIEIKISNEDYQRLVINMEPHERFSSEALSQSGKQNLVIYPDRDMDAPKIILMSCIQARGLKPRSNSVNDVLRHLVGLIKALFKLIPDLEERAGITFTNKKENHNE